jgi:hypothetical protein
MKRFVLMLALLALVGCHRDDDDEQDTTSGGEEDNTPHEVHTTLCPPQGTGYDHSEFDTNGDETADVVRVFRIMGEGAEQRRVLVCREVDLNADGRHDVVRTYSDEGRPLREQSDRDFDGIADQWDYFEDARVVRVEEDSNHDGIVDSKTYYVNGRASRVERDTLSRSTQTEWRPNRWEYFEDGHVVRMGEDADGDGRVDHWDRDEVRAEAERAEEARRAAEQNAADGASTEEENETGAEGDPG